MNIQSYQIHNVLNVYRRQLSQGKTSQVSRSENRGTQADSATSSSNINTQSVMEKVAESVLKKITNIDPESGFDQLIPNQTETIDDGAKWAGKENQFVFNTIAENNQKETRSIAVDNSQTLMSRLDELAKAAITMKNEQNS